jgi:hypothetical protein
MTMIRIRSLRSLRDPELPVDCYVRVGRVSDRGDESSLSPDVQRRAIEAWAAERNVKLICHEPEDKVSGRTMDTPAFIRLTERLGLERSGT